MPFAPALGTPPDRPPVGTFPRPDLVPYITQWSAEHAPVLPVVVRRGRIAYADERPYDRDSAGVLWTRVPSLPGKGKPEFGQVHALRQMRAIRELLCQVCGGPADRTAQGVLWLLGEDPNAPDSWPADLLTSHPPLCVPCAVTSVRACPHLRQQYTALRVRRFSPAGVQGLLYRPTHPAPVASDAAGIAFDDPRIHWVRAGQLITRLRDYTVVNLAAEYQQAA